MSKIRVGTGFLQVSLLEALGRAKQGDELLLSEGTHSAPDGIVVAGITLTGTGDPGKTLLATRLTVRGSVTIAGATIQAPPFNNALNVTPSAQLSLSGVIIVGDGGNKYPAIYAKNASVSLAGCTVHQADFLYPIQLENGCWFSAEDCTLGGIDADGGQVVLTGCTAGVIQGKAKVRIYGRGRLLSSAPDGYRCIAVSGESVADLEWLALANPRTREAWCAESMLRINRFEAAPGQSIKVLHKGAGRVDADDERITVVDPDAPKQLPERARWPLSERTHVLDQPAKVRTGGTLLLDAGEYSLDDCEDRWVRTGVQFEGAGEGITIVNGTFGPYGDATVTLRNLTLQAPAGRPVIQANSGTVVLEKVTLVQGRGGDTSTLFCQAARVVMVDCTIVSSDDAIEGSAVVADGGVLEATGSELGWVRLDGASSTTLENCSARWLMLGGGSTLRGTGEHLVLPNSCQKRALVVNEGSELSLDAIRIQSEDVEAFVGDSTIDITSLVAPENHMLTLHVEGSVPGQVPDVDNFLVVRDDEVQVQATSEESEWQAEEDGPALQGTEPDEPAEESEPAGAEADPMAEIMLLTGLSSVKEQVRSFLTMVRFNEMRRQQGLKATNVTMHSLFLGPPGTGKTTVARLLGKALFEAGAIRQDNFVEVGRRDLVSENLGGSARLTGQVLERARGGVLFIDEAYSLYQKEHNQFAQEAVDTILAFMENHRDDLVVVFAGYEEQMQDFLRMNPGLASRTPNTFTFEDYSSDEVASIGLQALRDDDYTVDEDLYRQVVVRKYEESVTGGNGRWVRNFNESLVKVAAGRIVSEMQRGNHEVDPSTITNQDLYQLAGGDESQREQAVAALLAQLDELVGLAPVKDFVRGLVKEAKANKMLAEQGILVDHPTYHMVFSGSPGTGKTTVASIVAQLFHNLGLLARPSVTEVDRSQLVGAYIGHTEEKTTRVLDNAMGGVLFVDEAYQLSPRGENDFGRMAIETMITRLENDRDKFVAIFAGYTADMDDFLAANEGLRSRVPLSIEFPDYSPDEVGQMVASRLQRTWTVDEEAVRRAAAPVYARLEPRDRSNGRWARTFAEAVVKRHKEWIVSSGVGMGEVSAIPNPTVEEVAAQWR